MQLPLWQILILAVVQGITEFLPISSDGHLTVLAALMAPQGRSESFEISDLVIVLHGGTLLSIIVFYWRRLRELLRGERASIGLVAAATVPALIVGLPAKLFAEKWLTDPVLAGACLMLTGVVLLLAARFTGGTRDYPQLRYREAIWIGVAQAAAILPGLSRSGCTIGLGMASHLHPRAAATFSFLMAIPVIGAACALELLQILHSGQLQTPVTHLAAGVAVSFVSGLLSLSWLLNWLERGRFSLYAWWCIPLGLAVLVWQLVFHGAV
jgi:undecaprenyl-diphosphatase